MSPLHDLATAAGLLIDWEDASGEPQRVGDDTLATVLAALGLPAATPADIAESRRRLREEEVAASDFLITQVGEPVAVPAGTLTLEQGGRRDVAAGPLALDEPGYHSLDTGTSILTIAVAPARAWQVGDAAPGRRIWAPAVQIPSLRDSRGEAFGDFGALARFAEAAAAHGADALAISPVHALFPADPSRFSPYAPSTRLFFNVFLADPSLLGGAVASGETGGDLIDWQTAIPERVGVLRALYGARTAETRAAVEAFRRAGGEELERHACYDALHARFFGTKHEGGWQAWPVEYRDPDGPTVAAFAREQAKEVGFYIFLQWLADRSLAAAQNAAKEAGMAVGLIADLAIGMDAGGSHGWARRDDLLSGLSIGAPPDKLGPDGQDWGITSFAPRALRRTGYRDFLATIRAALRRAGGIRIDHALGLRRLWVVPHGAAATEGAYLTYPEADMMRLLALESWRAKAIVVGEDLGTVPPGFREAMDEHGFLGMRVLWFERGRGGSFRPPSTWSRKAAALTGTHDLPTIVGWWQGRDIDWTWKLGRTSGSETLEAEHEARAKERARLWDACRKAGVADTRRPLASNPGPVVDAAIGYVASSPCEIAIVPAEDLLGLLEQPNLPGTIDEHPNWRRRLPALAEDMLDAPEVRARTKRLNEERGK